MYMQLTATTVIMYYILGHEHGNRRSRMAMAFAIKTHTGAGIKISRFLPTPRPSAQEFNAVLIFDVTVADLCSNVSLFFFWWWLGDTRTEFKAQKSTCIYLHVLVIN